MKLWFLSGFLCFCLGDYLGMRMPQSFVYVCYAAVLVIALLTVSYIKAWNLKYKALIGIAALLMCGGVVGSDAERNYREASLENYFNKNVTISGKIDLLSVKRDDSGIGFLLDAEKIVINGVGENVDAKIRVWSNRIKYTDVLQGKAVLQGELKEIYNFANPGSFDSESWNKAQNIRGRIIVRDSIRFSHDDSGSADFFRFAVGLRDKIRTAVFGESGALLCGLVLGGYDGLNDVTEEAFSETGLTHILSVSGTHMAIIAGALSAMVARKHRRYIVIPLFFYALLCGGAAAVWRSFLMSAIVLFGNNRYYKAQSDNILCFSGIMMLSYNPFWLTEPGFQLSFAATAGLVYFYPVIKNLLNKYVGNFLADGLAVTIAAQIFALPLLVYHFHYVSVLSFIANILFVPILEIILIIGLAGVLLPYEIGEYVLRFAGFLTEVNILFITALSSFKWCNLVVSQYSVMGSVLYYVFVGVMFGNKITAQRKKQICIAVMIFAAIGLVWQKCLTKQSFTVHFMDVGQGDAALVQTPAGSNILIDCGGLSGDFDTGTRIVVPYLRYLGIDAVDLLALSHGHHDHAGGAAGVARLMEVRNVLLPYGDASEDLHKLLREVRKNNKFYAQTGSIYRINDCRIEIIHAGASSDGNESSVIMRIDTDLGSALFTGDADETMELMAASEDIAADVLKVSHHGSRYSSTDAFVRSVKPQYAVISVGRNNRYGHPAPESIACLQEIGATVLRTDLLGAVKVTFDETGRQWYSYRYHQEFF